jgi:N-acetylgalactosamine kinase
MKQRRPLTTASATKECSRNVSTSSRAWRESLTGKVPWLMDQLRGIYGDNESLVESKREALLRLVNGFVREYGEVDDLLLARSPCRINLKGVHVEHRRGEVNYVTHCRELMMAAAGRSDDRVLLRDTESDRFPASEFSISEEATRGNWRLWLDYIDSPGVKAVLAERRGHWANYVKASVLRLHSRFPRARLLGMNLMVMGDIPVSSGLSSSSAVVVASALAFQHLNGLKIAPAELVELCGEGEWYVGTRGGAGDHAAMIFGRRGFIAHTRFFPFELLEYVPLPEGHRVVIVNSLKQARKSGAVLSAYNETIAAYSTALMLVKHILVDEMGFDRRTVDRRLNHLGDINLNPDLFPDPIIYEMLGRMPLSITREELLARLPNQRAALEKAFATHDRPAVGYRSRAVTMFGLSEIARGHHCVKLLKAGDLRAFGRLMHVSHDGDRVVTWDKSGRAKPWDNEKTRVSDGYLRRLQAALRSGDARKAEAARLMFQPGGYRCSSEELDQIVDIARRVRGVVGAGLTGAGFGGCVLVLAKDSAVDSLIQALNEKYYQPRNLPLSAEVCVPVEGAGVLRPQ